MKRPVLYTLPCFSSAILLCLFACVAAGTTKKPPPKPVNINSASSSELQTVPGIGPATAEKILQMRKSYGTFKSVDDLLSIRGIGPKRLEKMRKYLTVGKPTAALPATPAAKCANCGKGKAARPGDSEPSKDPALPH
jgi:competence ComEA-like helix-hairpin-helix protein